MRYSAPTSRKVGPLFDPRSSIKSKFTVMKDTWEVLRERPLYHTNKKHKKFGKVSEHQRQLLAVIQGMLICYTLQTRSKICIPRNETARPCSQFSYIFERVIYSHDCCTYFKRCRRPGWKYLSDIADSAKDFVGLSLTSCFKFFSVVGDSILHFLAMSATMFKLF